MYGRTILMAASLMAAGTWLSARSDASLAIARAEVNSHVGMVVSVAERTLVMSTDGKEHSHIVADSVSVMVNGKAAKLEDLKKGMQIRVMTDKEGNVLSVATMDARKR